jgi:NADH dehydrogenase
MAPKQIVIIGGGFGGLYAAKRLRRFPGTVTLLDKRNVHLFQPLLYQVATGGVSPGDIASPLRAILGTQRNARVLQAEAIDVAPAERQVILRDGVLDYDTLVIATGVRHHYFGNEGWAEQAPGLKTIEEALDIRRRIFLAFEAAEREADPARRQAWMTFVVVGGGPTGVELAGALGELAHRTLRGDFRRIDPAAVRIVLAEGLDRLLPAYDPALSRKAEAALHELGVTVRTRTLVTELSQEGASLQQGDEASWLPAKTVLWAAGVKASAFGDALAARLGAERDRAGRIIVSPDLSVPGHPDIFVIGDLAHFAHGVSTPLPGVAPVAMQQGRYVADLIQARLAGRHVAPFSYQDKGSLAVIGRNRAVAEIGALKLAGLFAWLLWVFVHIAYLIEFDRKLVVLLQWAISYVTRKRGARLITGEDPFPLVSGDITEEA